MSFLAATAASFYFYRVKGKDKKGARHAVVLLGN